MKKPWRARSLARAGAVLAATTALSAVELVPELPSVLPPPPGWLHEGSLGLFTTNVTTAHAETSRDPEVSSGRSSTSFVGTFDETLWWRAESPDEFEQRLQTRYGRSRTGKAGWVETTDSIDYDGVYRHRYQPRRAVYGSLVMATAWTGPEPEAAMFDPLRAAVALGHSWLYENMLPLSDRLEARAGVRAQQRWGTAIDDQQRNLEVGPETYLRYQRDQSQEISYWAQIELFTEFSDINHLQGLVTAALQVKLTSFITVDARLRAYYEHHPKELSDSSPGDGYDEVGVRQETLIGIAVTW